MKWCFNCMTEKQESEFSRNKAKSDRLQSQCKACKRAWREANREKCTEKDRAYREANREKIRERNRAYNEANREHLAERDRAYKYAQIESLSDVYVRNLIAITLKTSSTKIPPELVELKRQHLAMHRAVQELGGAIAKTRSRT